MPISGSAGGVGSSGGAGGVTASRHSTAFQETGHPAGGRFREQFLEPYDLSLSMSDSNPDDQWNRVEVSLPSLMWPYRDDAKTGTGDLQWIAVQFARRRIESNQGFVSTSVAGPGIFPSQRGACYLWAPGVWWVRVSAGDTGGSRLALGFNVVPMPDPSVMSYFNFSRWTHRAEGVGFNDVPITPGTKILSVQESLECTAVQVSSVTDSIQLRWEVTPDVTNDWLARFGPTQGQNLITFEGPTFPLADLWAEANTGVRNIRTTRYK